jgi:hypothetical protein
MRDENETSAERRAAGKWLWEAAFGRPVQPISESSEGTVRHIYIRWLPPDPNDTSRVIEPEQAEERGLSRLLLPTRRVETRGSAARAW